MTTSDARRQSRTTLVTSTLQFTSMMVTSNSEYLERNKDKKLRSKVKNLTSIRLQVSTTTPCLSKVLQIHSVLALSLTMIESLCSSSITTIGLIGISSMTTLKKRLMDLLTRINCSVQPKISHTRVFIILMTMKFTHFTDKERPLLFKVMMPNKPNLKK